MKIDLKHCTEEELWKYIAFNLAKNDVDVILVGGAVVSIYSEGAYKSGDLDFVLNDFSRAKLEEVLFGLGFPVSIGEDYQITPDEIEVEGAKIKIYSPTDCVAID